MENLTQEIMENSTQGSFNLSINKMIEIESKIDVIMEMLINIIERFNIKYTDSDGNKLDIQDARVMLYRKNIIENFDNLDKILNSMNNK